MPLSWDNKKVYSDINALYFLAVDNEGMIGLWSQNESMGPDLEFEVNDFEVSVNKKLNTFIRK